MAQQASVSDRPVPLPLGDTRTANFKTDKFPRANRGYTRNVERALWSAMLVLLGVAGLTMLTPREFTLAVIVAIPCAIAASKARRALSARRAISGR